MKKLLKYLLIHPLYVLLIVLLLSLAVLALLTTSSTGTRILADNIQRFVPGLVLEDVQGALIRGLTLKHVQWKDESVQVDATGLLLKNEVDIGSLSTLRVEELHIDKLVVRLAETNTQEDSLPFSLPSLALPFNVDARQVAIDSLEVWQGADQLLQMRDATLRGRARNGALQVENMQAEIFDDQGKALLVLDGEMALDQPHELAINASVDSDSKVWGVGTAKIRLGGELENYDVSIEPNWQYAEYPRYQGMLKGKGTFEDLTVDALRLKGAAGIVDGSGYVGWQDGFTWKASLVGENIDPEQFAPEWPANLDVDLLTEGALVGDVTSIKLDIKKLTGKLREYSVDITGKGDWNGKLLSLQALDAKVGDNRLQATGKAADKVEMEWRLDAPKLAQLYPKITGNAKGNGRLTGLPDGSQLQLAVETLSGKVEGYDLRAKGILDWGNEKLAAQDVVVQSGNNRLEVDGQATEPFDLSWKVDAKNLANAWKGLGGSLQGEGILKGTIDKPQIQADLQGSKLRYQNYRLASLDLQAGQEGERYDIKAILKAFQSGDAEIKSAKIDGQGSVENHQVTAQIVHEEGKAEFSAAGGWRNEQWKGSVKNLSLRDTPVGDWNMAGAVNLSASANDFSSSEVCLTGKGARACGKPAWSRRAGFSISGALQQISLGMLRPWLPENVSVSGNANIDYRFEQRGGKPVAQATLRLPDSTVIIRDSKGKAETLQYANTRADVDLNDRRVNVQAQLDLVNRGALRAAGRIDLSPQDGRHRIDVNINVNVPEISWLEKFSAQIDQLKGQIAGDVRISGLLSKPEVSGTARLSNGQVHLPEAGVTLDAITLNMQAAGAERMAITGSMRAGQGVLNANGVLSLANLPQWRANVALSGNNLKLMDTHEVQALVSPNLQIQAGPEDVTITGTVLIPETTVSLREFPATTNVRSDDVIIVGRRGQQQGVSGVLVRETPLNINPNVTIELGEKVKFTGFGLDARLTGKLRVLRTRQDIVAQGVLNVVDGVYKAYGQNLSIERGRLLFNGPIDNPGLDVRAVREVEGGDVQVGIELAGTVQRPESSLFSSPQQTQSDTLSYLLTGRAMSTVSGDQSSLLMDAITGLGIAGGESLAQQIGGGLGLDDVGLTSRDGNFDQSELSLGKRLGPRLYVRYIVSLFDSLQRVAITYQINKRLQLQAESGIYQGLDLIYKVDTNKGPLGP